MVRAASAASVTRLQESAKNLKVRVATGQPPTLSKPRTKGRGTPTRKNKFKIVSASLGCPTGQEVLTSLCGVWELRPQIFPERRGTLLVIYDRKTVAGREKAPTQSGPPVFGRESHGVVKVRLSWSKYPYSLSSGCNEGCRLRSPTDSRSASRLGERGNAPAVRSL